MKSKWIGEKFISIYLLTSNWKEMERMLSGEKTFLKDVGLLSVTNVTILGRMLFSIQGCRNRLILLLPYIKTQRSFSYLPR